MIIMDKKHTDDLPADKEIKAHETVTEAEEKTASEDYVEDEADEVFDKKEHKKNVRTIISRIILIVCAVVFCVSAFMLINIFLEYKKGSDIYKGVQSEVLDENTPVTVELPDGEVEIPFTYNHEALLAINPDALGYLYVPSVNLRLPIVQGDDNEKYLETTIDGEINKNGCPFVDYRITGGMSASHLIIYGHTLYSGTMFSSLHQYRSSGFYATEGNDTFYIYTEDKLREYRIFSVYLTDPVSDTFTFNFPDLESLRKYAAERKEMTMYDTHGDASEATQIVTLSTCADNLTKRLIIHGVYVGETTIQPES